MNLFTNIFALIILAVGSYKAIFGENDNSLGFGAFMAFISIIMVVVGMVYEENKRGS